MTAPVPKSESDPILAAGSVGGALPRGGAGAIPAGRAALLWVLPGLETLLTGARGSLEDFADGERTPEAVGACVRALHQAKGTFEMLECYGVALLVGEMASLCVTLPEQESSDLDESCELLMRAILQLSDYLNLLATGRYRGPTALLPVVNDLRSIRGQPLLSEGALFNPQLNPVIPFAQARVKLSEARFIGHARQLRGYFQRGLMGWHNGKPHSQGLGLVEAVLKHLEKMTSATPNFRLWWATTGLVEALVQGGLESEPALRRMLKALDVELGRLGTEGAALLDALPPPNLLKNVLFYVQRATTNGPQVATVRAACLLEPAPPRASDAAARVELLGADLSAQRCVARVVQDELRNVADALDAYGRNRNLAAEWVVPIVDTLQRLSDTLAMLNFGSSHKRLGTLITALRSYQRRGRAPDENELMDLASEILSVDAALDVIATRGELGPAQEPAESTGVTVDLAAAGGTEGLDTMVIREVGTELSWAKMLLCEHIDSGHVGPSERLDEHLRRVAGSLRMLTMHPAAGLTDSWADAVRRLLQAPAQLRDCVLLDAMADAIESLQYYVESEVGLQLRSAGEFDRAFRLAQLFDARIDSLRVVSRQTDEPITAVDSALPVALSPELSSVVDADILAIFLEEAEEAVQTLKLHMSKWQDNPDDREAVGDGTAGLSYPEG